MFGQFLVKKHTKPNNKSFPAYAWVTEQLGVRIQPFYPLNYSAKSLDQHNAYLPQPYMYDRFTHDSDPLCPSSTSKSAPQLTVKENMLIYDINAQSKQDTEIMKSRIKAITGHQDIPNDIYEKRYLNCQFMSAQTSFEEFLSSTLEKKWQVGIKNMLALSPVTFTQTGQRVEPKISIQTILKYIVPFLTNYTGKSPFSYRIPHILFDVMSTNSTYYNTKPTDLWVNVLNVFM